jgi:hypothetical protein
MTIQGAVAIMFDLANLALSGRRFWWRAFAVSLACATTSSDAGSVTNTAIGTLAGLEHFSAGHGRWGVHLKRSAERNGPGAWQPSNDISN